MSSKHLLLVLCFLSSPIFAVNNASNATVSSEDPLLEVLSHREVSDNTKTVDSVKADSVKADFLKLETPKSENMVKPVKLVLNPPVYLNNKADEPAHIEKATHVEKVTEPALDAVDAVFKALSLVGTPYVYGGSTPDAGFDCSGFVTYVFNNVFGLKLPRTTADIAVKGGGEKVARDNLQIGDLVLFNTMRRSFSHVGIYIGKGMFIHAPSRGGSVRMDNLNDNYWVKRFTGARRFLSQMRNGEKI